MTFFCLKEKVLFPMKEWLWKDQDHFFNQPLKLKNSRSSVAKASVAKIAPSGLHHFYKNKLHRNKEYHIKSTAVDSNNVTIFYINAECYQVEDVFRITSTGVTVNFSYRCMIDFWTSKGFRQCFRVTFISTNENHKSKVFSFHIFHYVKLFHSFEK